MVSPLDSNLSPVHHHPFFYNVRHMDGNALFSIYFQILSSCFAVRLLTAGWYRFPVKRLQIYISWTLREMRKIFRIIRMPPGTSFVFWNVCTFSMHKHEQTVPASSPQLISITYVYQRNKFISTFHLRVGLFQHLFLQLTTRIPFFTRKQIFNFIMSSNEQQWFSQTLRRTIKLFETSQQHVGWIDRFQQLEESSN